MKKTVFLVGAGLLGGQLISMADPAQAWDGGFGGGDGSMTCPVSYTQLKAALTAADAANVNCKPSGSCGGFKNHFWAVVVNRQGVVCAVAYSGQTQSSQWLSSRQIAAAKAFTANGLSLDIGTSPSPSTGTTGPLSTAALYQFVQPSNPSIGNPLFGLEGGNVLDSQAAYAGNYKSFGTPNDPMIGTRVGGTITFGGGLALYSGNTVVGGLGLSGDTACTDHSVAYATRGATIPSGGSTVPGLNMAPPGTHPLDMLTFATNANMTNGHPSCPNDQNINGATNSPES
jgi:uncharacterized protein GlcG (DUF336 family)